MYVVVGEDGWMFCYFDCVGGVGCGECCAVWVSCGGWLWCVWFLRWSEGVWWCFVVDECIVVVCCRYDDRFVERVVVVVLLCWFKLVCEFGGCCKVVVVQFYVCVFKC